MRSWLSRSARRLVLICVISFRTRSLVSHAIMWENLKSGVSLRALSKTIIIFYTPSPTGRILLMPSCYSDEVAPHGTPDSGGQQSRSQDRNDSDPIPKIPSAAAP